MNNIITLKDASGNDVEFKMLDQFTHDKRTYVVLMPHNESTTQVSIYEVVPTKEEGVDGLLVLHLIKQILSLKYSKKETKTNLIL